MKTIAIASFVACLSLASGCGSSSARHHPDGSRPTWGWDVSPDQGMDQALPRSDVTPEPDAPTVEETMDVAEPIIEDASLPIDDGDAAPVQSYQCGDGYVCLTSCENRCGLHELGRSTCVCQNGVLQCSDCQLTALARPQVPEIVSAICADSAISGTPCSQVGEACFSTPDSPYPNGCLCWPTATGMLWNCAPVFDWFTLPSDAGQ